MIIKKKNIKIKETEQDDIVIQEELAPDVPEEEPAADKEPDEEDVIEQFEDIDISNVDFRERIERRRGDRRRGYRRIDERNLVSRAQEEALSIRENAKKEGYNEGLAEAKNEIEKIKEGITDFYSGRKEIYQEISKDMLDISLEIAKKIIKKEVELSDEVLQGVLKEVLEQVKSDEQKITFKVSPSDYEVSSQIIPQMLEKARINAKLTIIPSEDIEKGSCMLIADNGVIDTNFKTQLHIIQMAFGIYKGKDSNN